MTVPRGARAVLLAVVVVASLVAPAVGPVGEASAAPSGFVTVPDTAIHSDLPVGADVGVTRADLEGSTMVSAHASTTEIVLTTPERAGGYLNDSATVVGSGEIALVISDDSAHEGRQVAVPADAIEAATGQLPEAVHGTHEDGSEWTRQVRAEGGLLIFEVPHFSSNTVTFSGTVNVTGTYSDGSSVSYDLMDVDAATDPNITLTGTTATEWDNETASGLGSSGLTSISVARNLDPNGPSANGEPTLTVSEASEYNYSVVETNGDGTADSGVAFVGDNIGDTPINSEVKIRPAESGSADAIRVNIDGTVRSDYGAVVDVYLAQESNPDGVTGEGTLIRDGWDPDWSTGSQKIVLDKSISLAKDTNYTVEFVTQSTDSDGAGDRLDLSVDSSPTSSWYETNIGGSYDYIGDIVVGPPEGVNSLSVSDGNGLSKSIGDLDGNSTTVEFDVTTSSTELNFSGSGAGSLNPTLKIKERSETVDPSVPVNGEVQASHSGTLADGSTVTFTGNKSSLQSGTNTVNVSMGSVSSDTPAPTVDLAYEHDASDEISVEYAAEGWTERYNVSHTYSSTQESPTLTVPFSGEVHELVRLEERTNGGTWSDVPTERYSLDGSTLTVQLDDGDGDGDGDGDVDAGTDVAVRTTARRVEVLNGAISVTDPILPGEDADVQFQIDSRSSGFAIDLRKLPTEGVRYTYDESWSSPESRMVVTASGARRLELPNAAAGDSARVTHVPVTVTPETGEAVVQVADPDEPTITLGSGASSGDDVTIAYLEASTGTTYELYSTSRDRVVATSTADAGTVTFVEDDSAESLRIQANASGGGGGGMFADASPAPSYGVDRPLVIIGGLAGLVLLLVWATGRSGLSGTGRWAVVGGVSGAAGLLAFEALNPGSISSRIGEGIGSVVPLAGIAAIGLVGYTVVSWWRSRQKEAATPETSVSFNLRGRNK